MTDICYFLERVGIGNGSFHSDDKERRERLDDPGRSKENMILGYDLRSAASRAERRSLAGFPANDKQLANVAKITCRVYKPIEIGLSENFRKAASSG